MENKTDESVRIYMPEYTFLDQIKSKMKLRGKKLSYAVVMEALVRTASNMASGSAEVPGQEALEAEVMQYLTSGSTEQHTATLETAPLKLNPTSIIDVSTTRHEKPLALESVSSETVSVSEIAAAVAWVFRFYDIEPVSAAEFTTQLMFKIHEVEVRLGLPKTTPLASSPGPSEDAMATADTGHDQARRTQGAS